MSPSSISNIDALENQQLHLLKLMEDIILKLPYDNAKKIDVTKKLEYIINKCYEFIKLEFILSAYEFNSKEYFNGEGFIYINMTLKNLIKNGEYLAENISVFDWVILKSEVSYFLYQLNNADISVDELNEIVDAFSHTLIKDYTLNDGLSVDIINRTYNNLVISLKNMACNNYDNYLKTEYWKRFRDKARKYFGERCLCCDTRVNLEIHHNNYDCIGEETFPDVYLLCSNCHREIHNKP